jgi:DNA-binding MarR family transcriptional regulator
MEQSMALDGELHRLVDALAVASRALVGVAARSVAELEEVTLPQWRALVLISTRERTTVSDLAAALDVNPASATRLCDRLVAKHLVRRSPADADRRQIVLTLAAKGRQLVDRVTARRWKDLATIAARIDRHDLEQVIAALEAFGAAGGELLPGRDALGWNTPPRTG